MTTNESLPELLSKTTQNGQEISITAKWVATKNGGLFRKSAESKEMLKEWEDIHSEAKKHKGILSTEINHALSKEAVLVHHVFKDSESLIDYFAATATNHKQALMEVANPELHLVRGTVLSNDVISAIRTKVKSTSFGEYLFGFVKNDYHRPDPEHAIQVTAKWTCKEGASIDELIYWWQRVGTDAHDMEKGLVRYEVYRAVGEDALIIHETFDDTKELQFHLSKGTAAKYKKDIDLIAAPENYYFRGPVSWTIRTYSKFLGLPATYSSQGSHYVKQGGNYSDGLI
ncbi:MAG: quinol monooxygenase YgiN [Bacteroidia bacterium]|jgi:quinol monooxygenase YgiN